MALALSHAGRLTADIRLAQAVSKYEASLSDAQKAEFRTRRYKARTTAPGVDDVMKLTAEVDRQVGQRSGARRCFGPRFTNVLHSVQQYAALGDVVIGGSQNLVACGVWCVVRMSLLLLAGYSSHLERFSTLFMAIGRSSPRYQDLALLYSNSGAIRRYLAEYFIVVVDICYQFLIFSRKSVIGQIKSSLIDGDLHQAETKLEEWALNIKDEAEILNTKTLVGEARENSRLRAMFEYREHNLMHQNNIKRRVRWVDACTTYDHETPWKQARKHGNTSILVNDIHYQEWKSQHRSSMLVICGKLGSGKTVLAANVVDEIHLTSNETVCYFFCRHDILYSCLARTIIGSLCRQLLSGHINEDKMDGFLGEYVQSLSFDDVVGLTKNVLSLKGRCYFILDGLDDCDDIERRRTTEALHRVQETTQLLIFVSLRSQVDEVETEFRGLRPQHVSKMPEENPEIGNFVLSALKEKVETGELVLGDQSLIMDIRDALIAGAQGMFLWVVLQIDCLCKEQTYQSIREALRNLPPDLSTTYDRILRRSEHLRGQSYQRQILSFLLATIRPLEVNELRQALAIVPGDIKWKPDNQINNMYHTLTCCESLVIVAEEERTVHFVHQSVVQFLLDQRSTSTSLRFDLAQASLGLGEVCVTYLNYGIFDQRVSKNVIPTIPAGVIPTKIAQDTLKESGLVGQLALMLLNFQSTDGPEIGKILADTGRLNRKRQETAAFEFLKYASQHWLIHTVRIDHMHSTFSLWKGLLQHSKFDGLVWGPNEIHPDKLLVDGESGNIWMLAPRVTWAISHSHLPLLLLELRSRRGLKAFCNIIPYIRVLMKAGDRLKVDAAMALKLFKVAVVAEAADIANFLLQNHQTSCSKETFLDAFVKQSEPARIGWIISLKSFGSLPGSLSEWKFPIVEFACNTRNLQLLDLALNFGARIDLYDENPLALLFGKMRDPLDLALAYRLLKARFPLKGCKSILRRLYWLLRHYTLVNDLNSLDPYRIVMSSLEMSDDFMSDDFMSTVTCESLIRRACLNGNLQMVQKFLSDEVHRAKSPIITYFPPETVLSWIVNALCTYSAERREIVLLLGQHIGKYLEEIRPIKKTDDWNFVWLDAFRRCLQLRAWELAEELADTIRWAPYLHLQAASFRKVLMNYSDGNRRTDGSDTDPTSGDEAQRGSGADCKDQGAAETNVDASGKKKLEIDENEATGCETSYTVSLIHFSASCGDVTGAKFLLGVLASDAQTILSASSPLDSYFGGDVPLQTLLSQDQSTIEETTNFLRIGCTFLRLIGDHGSSACGQNPKSCADLAPRFCANVVRTLIQQDREVWIPSPKLYRFRENEKSRRCFKFLAEFLTAWIAHLPPSANPRGLLMPMLDAIVRGFGEVKAELESHLSEKKTAMQPASKVYYRERLGSVLEQSLGGLPGLDDMLRLLLFQDPFLQDDIASFEEYFHMSTRSWFQKDYSRRNKELEAQIEAARNRVIIDPNDISADTYTFRPAEIEAVEVSEESDEPEESEAPKDERSCICE